MPNNLELLINTALDKKPNAFADVFNNAMVDAIQTRLDAKKVEISNAIFNPPAEDTVQNG